MPLLEPMENAGWEAGGPGWHVKSHGMPVESLPGQQGMEDLPEPMKQVYSILGEQYQNDLQEMEFNFNQNQQLLSRDTGYKLKTLSDKYWQERNYLDSLQIPADQKRQKLMQLNNKYELAAITAKSKIKPNNDLLAAQRQQQLMQLQEKYKQKSLEINQIQRLVDKGIITDPYAGLREQLNLVGVDVSANELRPPKPLTYDELTEQSAVVTNQIVNLEEALKTATGEERTAIANQIEQLENQREGIMKQLLPGFEPAIEKSNKLSKVGLQMTAGRKPGTLAEGVWQKKQSKLNVRAFRGWAPGFPAQKKTEKTIEPIYQKNQKTGQSRVSYDGGKTWQTIG